MVKTGPYNLFSDKHVRWYLKGGEAAPGQTWILTQPFFGQVTLTPLSLKILSHEMGIILLSWDFPGGAVVKNPPAKAGDTGSNPSLGRSHMPRSN